MAGQVAERFVGLHPHTLDGKGRLILPAAFRESFADGLFLVPGHERCLIVYTTAAYDKRLDDVEARPIEDKESRDLLRVLTNTAHADTPDVQGRITVPAHLREYAGLQREIYVAGSGRTLEIWDRPTYASYRADIDPRYSGLDSSPVRT